MGMHIPLRAFDRATYDKIAAVSGEIVGRCMQCGTCSAVCPMVESMDVTVRQTMLMLQCGQGQQLAQSKTASVCAACHACEVRCPRGIDIPALMEAIRQLRVRQGDDIVNPRAIPREKLRKLPPIAMVAGFREFTL